MSSMPRAALKTKASNPGAIAMPNSALNAAARVTSPCSSCNCAGVSRFTTSTAV
jgi:hypothetical protein